jgi:hypothetical protein
MVSGWFEEREDLLANYTRDACYGGHLTQTGWEAYERAMPEALESYDDDWLTREMAPSGYWLARYRRRLPRGGYTMVRVNRAAAARTLCQGEFNIAYVRGLARALLRRGEIDCIVHRAAPALEPRAECSGWEGQRVSLEQVLEGHRARYHPPPGDRGAWSLPTGPNCHHSIHAVDAGPPPW